MIMSEFNIKDGLVKSLKTALKDNGFISAFFKLLANEPGANEEFEFSLKRASQENTLNEMVAVHRLFNGTLNEVKLGVGVDSVKAPKWLKQMKELRKESVDFQKEVLLRTLKKPGMKACFFYVVKALATPGYVVDDVLAAPQTIKLAKGLIESAIEIKQEKRAISEEKIVKSLNRLLNHASRQKRIIKEEMEDKYGGRMPVNVYTGRFQPFHLGHLSNLEEAAKRGLRTVICPVMAGKTAKSIAAHPFNGELEDEMFRRLQTTYKNLIAGIIPISRPSLDCWVEQIREKGMEPITWTTGMDRKPSYENMIVKYGPDFNLVKDFEVIGLEKDMDAEGGSADDTGKISGTAIRQCLVDGNEEGYRAQMPQCLWDMYDAFRQALMPAQQTITESKEFKDFKKHLSRELDKLIK